MEFYSLPLGIVAIQDKFILGEMGNAVTYFSALFGQYPFKVFRAAIHPYSFGQGFPTMLMIPPTDRADKNTYSFIAHETSHQWWGHMVLWRSYRDQWLSEGFAEYSGLLYTGKREPPSQRELIERLRDSLRQPPMTALGGTSKGRLTDVGPLIMGHRLATRETVNAYTTLIYNKGALVLRMLHFLFTDPASGNGQPFFDMMRDFVGSHQGQSVSTDDFLAVANAHFAETPIARRSGVQDLAWFFRQWVYQTYLPSYRLEYSLERQDDDSYIVRGTVFQEGIPDNETWFMPLPVVFNLGGNKKGRSVVYAQGPQAPFALKLPSKPDSVELDPDWWVLSDKTSTKAVKGK
jgi:aminopeptidase N